MQKFFMDFKGGEPTEKLSEIIKTANITKLFIVCDKAYGFLSVSKIIDGLSVYKIKFDGFEPNPKMESVDNGFGLLKLNGCDGILAVGGGSAIDVAKCIKLKGIEENYGELPFIALPTTAGTGSESTRFAVVYKAGEKQSVNDVKIIPNYVILSPNVLLTLPVYQKKCTLLDALCQAIESWWSVNANDESIEYSKKAIKLITENYKAYVFGDIKDEKTFEAAGNMSIGANYAGRAINITQTTAAHAMSYKLTSLYNLPHGHAVAVSLLPLYEFMISHTDRTADACSREMKAVFEEISKEVFGVGAEKFAESFKLLLEELGIETPAIKEEDIPYLAASVNPVRLKNNPIKVTSEEFEAIYATMKG